jgi:hypothetical protein
MTAGEYTAYAAGAAHGAAAAAAVALGQPAPPAGPAGIDDRHAGAYLTAWDHAFTAETLRRRGTIPPGPVTHASTWAKGHTTVEVATGDRTVVVTTHDGNRAPVIRRRVAADPELAARQAGRDLDAKGYTCTARRPDLRLVVSA